MSMETPKSVFAVGAQTIATDTTVGTNTAEQIDCRGYDWAVVNVLLSTDGSVAPTVLELLECDTTVVSSFATISGAVAGTDYTIPTPDTSTLSGMTFCVDLRGRKRYLRCDITATAGGLCVVSTVANLFRGEVMPNTAAKANDLALVTI